MPEKFVRKFGDELSSIAILRVPDGRVWPIVLTKIGGNIWFDSGWDNFIEYYSISGGGFMVFKYGGKSNFHVIILDMAACEIDYPLRTMDTTSQQNQPTSSFCSIKANMTPKDAATLGSSKFKNGCDMQSKKRKMEEVEVINESDSMKESRWCKLIIDSEFSQQSFQRKRHLSENAQSSCANTKFKKTIHSVEDEHQRQVGDEDENELFAQLEEFEIFICDSYMSDSVEERKTVITAIRFLKPKNPSFLVIMRASEMRKRYVYVPLAFGQKYLSKDEHVIIQDSNGKKLAIKRIWTCGKCFLTGWSGTLRLKKVIEGDVLIFEMIKRKKVVLKLLIFRPK